MWKSYFKLEFDESSGDFKKREDDILKIIRYMPRVINKGINENFFVIGENSSEVTYFVKYVGEVVLKKFNMLPIYVDVSQKEDIDEIIHSIFEELFCNCDKLNCSEFFEKLAENKGDCAFDINLQKLLSEIFKLTKDYKGLFLILDNVGGLCDLHHFPDWYKAFSDTIDFYEDFFPVAFLITSSSKVFCKFTDINSSFSRIFHLTDLDNYIILI